MRVQLLLCADARLLKIESDPTNPLRVPIVSLSFRKSTKYAKNKKIKNKQITSTTTAYVSLSNKKCAQEVRS